MSKYIVLQRYKIQAVKQYESSLPFKIAPKKNKTLKLKTPQVTRFVETHVRDFCIVCGAHIPPYVGEGTCPACSP